MIRTDGTPTVAWAGASVKDKDTRRRWLQRKRERKLARLAQIRNRRA
jgi:hypothetical protein